MERPIRFLFLTALLPCIATHAQQFPVDSAEWSIAFTAFNLPPNGGYTTTTVHYGIRGDTLIDGMSWSKLFEDTAAADMAFVESNAVLIGAIRENMDGMVMLHQDGSNYLLFDFSLTVGDQFSPLGPYGYVSAVDTVFVGGAWRRQFAIDPGFALWPLEYMEGIGYIHGQGVMNGWRYWNIGIHMEFELLCMEHYGQRIYGNGPCHVAENTVPTQVSTTTADPRVLIFPSPFAESFTVRCDPPVQEATLLVSDIIGRRVHQQTFVGTEVRAEGMDLPKGLYIVTLLEGGRLIHSSALMAQ